MTHSAAIDFKELIQGDRAKNGKRHFKGSFLEYLELVRQNPRIGELAHARLYDIITGPGFRVLNKEENPKIRRLFRNEIVKSYKFFEDEFFGMEKVLAKIIRYFRSASLKGEESRQVLYLVGPVGSGKSSLIEKIKEGLIRSEPYYALEGCPMNEEPLHLVPHHLREELEKILNVSIEGDLCPVCRYRLREEFKNQYEDFPVVTVEFSKRARRGIGVVPPVDPNNQDTSVLIGSEDISKLDKYPEDDPRVLSLNGAFNAGNRGMVEFIEVFKNEIEYLHIMITATQEKSIPSPGKQNMIYFDGVIVAHSNEAEWNKFKADHTNEAILDRIVKIEVPYVLELSEEVSPHRSPHDRDRRHVRDPDAPS
jgi:serine protein kinase